MLRSSHHPDVVKLDLLQKSIDIVAAKTADADEEVIEFLREERTVHEDKTDLMLTSDTEYLKNYRYCANTALSALGNVFYQKYKDIDLSDLYFASFSIHNRVFDSAHFQELVKHFDKGTRIEETKNAQFEFLVLDDEYEEKERYEYKVMITCDNDSSFEIFVNSNSDFFRETIYTKNYEDVYHFSGTHAKELVKNFNFLKMMKTIISSGREGKKYKLYR